jgi:GNAT superfamily N-acetyltransferase
VAAIRYSTSAEGIDWQRLKADLVADGFDNGRTAAELERSFRGSFRRVCAFDGARVIGTVRALSDGVCNAYVVDTWTHSAYRRRGIARRMMEFLCEPLAGQHVYLFTDDQLPFYAACGFQPRGTGMERVIGVWLNRGPRT